jgi:hypothetical protein
MPHLDIPPSKWDTSVGALKVRIADARRLLGHNLAAIGERSGVSERAQIDPVLANAALRLFGDAILGAMSNRAP